jgi:hypothetical protein
MRTMRGRDDLTQPSGTPPDDARTHAGQAGAHRNAGELQAEAAPAEGLLDEVRAACQRVRDAWRELWR